MKKSAYRQLEKRAKMLEENWGSVEEFVLFSTFGTQAHTMKMREEFLFDESLLKVYDDLSALERCDLLDFEKLSEENGKFGKTRRYIFC